MKVSKTENRFKTGFQQPKTGLKKPILTSLLVWTYSISFILVGHGGALVESIAFNRRVVGSTPALAAM